MKKCFHQNRECLACTPEKIQNYRKQYSEYRNQPDEVVENSLRHGCAFRSDSYDCEKKQ